MKLDKEQQIESTVNREKRNNWGTINTFENDESIEKIKKCKNCQGCILSPCLFNLYAEYIMRNTGLEETQAGLKSLLMKVKEDSDKVGLKLNI